MLVQITAWESCFINHLWGNYRFSHNLTRNILVNLIPITPYGNSQMCSQNNKNTCVITYYCITQHIYTAMVCCSPLHFVRLGKFSFNHRQAFSSLRNRLKNNSSNQNNSLNPSNLKFYLATLTTVVIEFLIGWTELHLVSCAKNASSYLESKMADSESHKICTRLSRWFFILLNWVKS